jgi:GT2 family glycosyltransferase
MQPTVTAIVVARDGAQYLPRTLAAIAAQTRRPDSIVYVDAGSSDGTAALLATTGAYLTTPGRRTFGGGVDHAVRSLPPQSNDQEWLWLLAHDNAPDADALAALLAAVEVAPSVAVAGPKLMALADPHVIASFGETLTDLGRSIELVDGELDQAQHDVQSDRLGVAAGGMLVRRQVWTALGGFDPALPSVDASLDFCVRTRLAGHRVVGVAAARVASAGPAELFGRRSLSAGAQNRIRRSAQLHRRLAYAPSPAVPLHWLTLVPLAVLRSLVHLLAKRPGAIGGEFRAAFGAAFHSSVPRARATIRRNRVMGWAAVGALRMPLADVRHRRSIERAAAAPPASTVERPGFFSGGGAWVVLLAAVASILVFGRFVDAPALAGGGLLPLSATVGELWGHIGYGWHDIASGFVGAADPFSAVLAVLGSLSFWSPSLSIVAVYLIAIPLSALTAWWCAARFSSKAWAPAIAALAWAVAPPLIAGMNGGHLGAVIAHILLPILVLSGVAAARSWSMAAVAALLFAAVVASAPVLAPALVIALVVWALANPRAVVKIIGIVIPATALFAPLVIAQVIRGTPLALLAEPGAPVLSQTASGWQLALGASQPGLSGWESFLVGFGMPAAIAPVAVTVLLAPFAVLALLSLFVPGSRRAIPAMVLALFGFVTAVVGGHLQVALVGATPTPIWAGAALSLYWLGLVGGMTVGLEALGRASVIPALVTALGLVLLSVPAFALVGTGASPVAESNGRMLPAFASAEAASDPGIGTLELTSEPDGGLAATVHRGLGTSLDEQSTLAATASTLIPADGALTELAGNIASRSGFDVAGALDSQHIAFVLLRPGDDAMRQRVAEALDGNRLLTPIGSTSTGTLWHYATLANGPAPGGPSPVGTPFGLAVIIVQAVVFGLALLLAVPTTRRRRVRSAKVQTPTIPASSIGEVP